MTFAAVERVGKALVGCSGPRYHSETAVLCQWRKTISCCLSEGMPKRRKSWVGRLSNPHNNEEVSSAKAAQTH